MDQAIQQIMTKVAAYIEATQPLIDVQLEKQSEFVKRATQAAGVLAHRGVIDSRRVNEFIDKVAANPSAIWDFVEKMAATVAVDSLGDAVSMKAASGESPDAWERVFFGRGAERTGMVD